MLVSVALFVLLRFKMFGHESVLISMIGGLLVRSTFAGLAIAEGLSATDRSRYDRLLSSVDIAPPGAAGAPQG